MLSRRSLFRKGILALGSATIVTPSRFLCQPFCPPAEAEKARPIPLRIIVVESQAEADQILKLLKTGEDFGSIAVEQSIDPTSNQAGYLGAFDPAQLRPELRDALKGIQPGEFSSVVKIPEGYAILKIDAQSSPGPANDDTKRLLALVAPGAVRYGPDVDGFNEAVAVFTNFPDNPAGWNRTLSPVKVTEIHQKPLSSAIRHLQETVPPLNHGAVPAKEAFEAHYLLAQLYAFQGQMDSAIQHWEDCYQLAAPSDAKMAHFLHEVLGIAYLHRSEMENDIYSEPGERCLFPMPAMRYSKTSDSEKALDHFEKYLEQDPDDLEARWLMNLTCMTLGKYPSAVPTKQIIPLDGFKSTEPMGRFADVAPDAGLGFMSTSGGIIVDDFENRGLFDIITSDMNDQIPGQPLHYFRNNGDGTFSDETERSGLKAEIGGLNMIQCDYNNDGNLDVLVLRGAWEYPLPLSLFRGNGDGTFTDVTAQAGLTELIATQTAVWADINNDGLLDLFVGNERGPSHLFLNKGDGTFEDISASSGVDRIAFTKGVVAGDYDNDGYIDFYVSNLSSNNFLYHNNRNNTFKEVAREAGVQDPFGKSFTTWFFDYDNDGWLDLFVTSYYSGSVDETIRTYLGLPPNAITLKLYKNSRDGAFDDVTSDVGLDKVFLPMGANFGDVDNDGFLDIYLGTGDPSYGSLVPNVLLRNDEGKRFADVTASSGTGELHKGHGVAFADMSNTGQQDILTVIGGVALGDRHAFRFFKNPGNANDWIRIKLTGVKSNRAAIGARIKVTVENEDRGRRFIHRTVGSGGSFGASPLEQHIGLGPAAKIESIEVSWPAIGATQVFSGVRSNQVIAIQESANQYVTLNRPKIPLPKRAADRG